MKHTKPLLAAFAAASAVLLSGCNVAISITDVIPEEDLAALGILECENAVTGGHIKFDPTQALLWKGTAGSRIEVNEMNTGKSLMIKPGENWACTDQNGNSFPLFNAK